MIDDVLEQTLAGLGFLHALQIIHRDIKPDNVMLRQNAGVSDLISGVKRIQMCIVDFDMCCFLHSGGAMVATTLEGTPGYLAPEVLTSRRYTVMSDLFAFGCFSYFIFKRQEPCPELSIEGMQSLEMIETLHEWLGDAVRACADVIKRASAPMARADSSASERSPTTLDHSENSPGIGPNTNLTASVLGTCSSVEPCFNGVPARLWRLLAWCLERDPTRRPASVEALLNSGLLRFPEFSPKTAGNTWKKERPRVLRSNSSRTSIDDLLKMKGHR